MAGKNTAAFGIYATREMAGKGADRMIATVEDIASADEAAADFAKSDKPASRGSSSL